MYNIYVRYLYSITYCICALYMIILYQVKEHKNILINGGTKTCITITQTNFYYLAIVAGKTKTKKQNCLSVKEYEEEILGLDFNPERTIKDFTRWNKNSIDILDGCHDTYIFDNYAISKIYCTNNGIVLLDCIDLYSFVGDDEEEKERHRTLADGGDFFEIVNSFYAWCDFDTVTFRLN